MRILLLLALLAAFASGCGTGPARPDEEQMAAAEAARADMEAGAYTAAAEQFRRLAEDARGALADEYRIAAAEAYLEAGSPGQTRVQLQLLEPDAKEQPELFTRKRLLQAHLALDEGEPARAQEYLQDVEPPDNRPLLRGRYHLLRARVHEQQGSLFAAVAERLAADHELRDDRDRRMRHVDALWKGLRRLERAKLNELRDNASPAAAGWLELALIEKAELTDPANLRRTLDDWQLQYPAHPAVETVLPELRELAERIDRPAKKIALILPFSSAYGEAARIIRDGFLAGWYRDDSQRPEILVYDSGQQDLLGVYTRAVEAGAEMVVGPLQKEAVRGLVESGQIRVPTLALNQYEGDLDAIRAINRDRPLPRLYQFSLAPEGEARQIAERAWFDGHARALAMTPANEWGERVFQAFRESFEKLGGTVLEHVSYPTSEPQYSEAVRALLNIDESEQRYKTLRAHLQRSLESEPRRRQDPDFIMLGGYPAAGRQIGPQLQYHLAGDIPVYATSHIYTGVVDRSANADLNGFRFSDMPWLLDPAAKQTPLYEDISRYWPNRLDSNPRLYAFGIDAYRLLAQLGRMALDGSLRFDGVSGRLAIDQNGHVRRQLQWAQFVDGTVKPLDDGSIAARP